MGCAPNPKEGKTMTKFLFAAGPPVWLVLALGVAALAAAVLHLRNRQARSLSLAIGFTVAALAAGTLGTVLGFQRSVAHLAEVAADRRWIYLLGLGESLNNLVVALAATIVVSLILGARNVRRPLEP